MAEAPAGPAAGRMTVMVTAEGLKFGWDTGAGYFFRAEAPEGGMVNVRVLPADADPRRGVPYGPLEVRPPGPGEGRDWVAVFPAPAEDGSRG